MTPPASKAACNAASFAAAGTPAGASGALPGAPAGAAAATATAAGEAPSDTRFGGPVLALDSGSPVVSVAVARRGALLAARSVEIGVSSQRLLPMIDEALAEAGVGRRQLAGLVALAGPGSFTGLRVGLATALGIHQALGVPAAAVPTLEALAWTALAAGGEQRILALVDVLRDEWAVQEFTAEGGALVSLGEPERLAAEAVVARLGAGAVGIGFGVSALAGRFELPAGARLVESSALADAAARRLSLLPPAWDATSLTRPLYFRSPAVSLPKRRPAAAPPR